MVFVSLRSLLSIIVTLFIDTYVVLTYDMHYMTFSLENELLFKWEFRMKRR